MCCIDLPRENDDLARENKRRLALTPHNQHGHTSVWTECTEDADRQPLSHSRLWDHGSETRGSAGGSPASMAPNRDGSLLTSPAAAATRILSATSRLALLPTGGLGPQPQKLRFPSRCAGSSVLVVLDAHACASSHLSSRFTPVFLLRPFSQVPALATVLVDAAEGTSPEFSFAQG